MNPESNAPNWFEIHDVAAIPSPGLLVYRERVEENIRRMLTMAGGPARLRPHIKTHKMREMLELQMAAGIYKFKCATLAEAGMAASAGASDLLMAYPPVGPNLLCLADLVKAFPNTKFSVIGDDAAAIRALSRTVHETPCDSGVKARAGGGLEVLLDIDVGQHRTGVPPDSNALEMYRLIASLPDLKPGGLHVYDGHIGNSDPAERTAVCEQAFAPVLALKRQLLAAGFPVPRVVAGGTPTFRAHANRGDVECSPGTCVFWDAGYARKLPDLDFLPAALVLTRVVSKPGPRRLCLDLGHKAIASEMPHPRVQFLNLDDAQAVSHSEEHLVVETGRSGEFGVGDCLYGIPWHICPTVALHSQVAVIENGKVRGYWKVAARDRQLML